VFTNVPELFVLVPVIYNLRGILEQGLTSRLSKASQIGVMDSISGRKKIWLGNLNLVMFQSITAGLFAGIMSCFLSWLSDPNGLQLWRSILMIVVAAATTASASIISGFFLFLILNVLKWAKLSPNDLLGPLTSSFGGFMSLFILAIYAGFFYLWMGSWIGIVAVVCLLIVANIYFYSKAQKNEAVGTLTSEGWPSMLFSLLVTGLSGLLLQRFISRYQSVFALFLPVFTGITGTFAGIYSSEAITHLHLFQLNPMLPRKTALTLLILSNPVQLILVLLIGFLNSDQISISFTFILSYLIAENVQVLFLMGLADLLIKLSWKFSIKPESNVPALMSTLSDFSGTLVLVAVFYVLKHVGKLENPAAVKVVESAAEIVKEIATTATASATGDSL
jgi:solute carrier family 41